MIDHADARPLRAALDQALPGTVVFVGVDPHYALGCVGRLERFAVACRHETPALRVIEQRGIPVLCLERLVGREGLPGRSTAHLVEHPAVQAWLGDLESSQGPVYILMFKPSAQVEATAAARGWRVLGAPASLARRMENKVQFFRLLDALDLPHPPWLELDLGTTSYEQAGERLGPTMVVQGAHGFSGNRTFLVTDAASYQAAAAILRGRRARSSTFIGGAPLTLTGCVVDAARVLVGRLFHQVTGVPACTVYPLGACGNDWSALPPDDALQRQARGVAEQVGGELGRRGFRGIFGMDFVVGDEGRSVAAIEVNPRIVSSVPMATLLEEEAGLVPLLAWHLLATSGALEADEALAGRWPDLKGALEAWSEPGPLRGAQLVLHNLEGADAEVTGRLEAGAWDVGEAGDAPSFARSVLEVTECGVGEIMVLPPAPGHDVQEAGECGRVQCRHALLTFPRGLSAGPGALTEEGIRVSGSVYDAIGLRPLARGAAGPQDED